VVTNPKPFVQKKRLRVLQVGAAVFVAMILFATPIWEEGGNTHEIIEMTGIALVLACIFGRLWSILYVGGRKNQELVTAGPYSMTRNPLYFFSTVGIVGVGLMFGSISVALILGLLTFQVFAVTASKEAAFLKSKFGTTYENYALKTPLFWPNLLRYRDGPESMFSPGPLRRTFVDGMYFLAIFPAIEAVELLRQGGYLPTLLRLY
jgi:protein-S-isoprenylcysteine O-methyltransferase Ste14